MSNSIVPGSSADVNVKVTALTTNPNVPVTYKTIILKKNLVNGVNTLTQEMISATNTKYVIKYDYVLSSDITIPSNCVLEFDGGSISGEYTIIGTNTCIKAELIKIFNTDIILAGTWNVTEAYPEWFGAKGDSTTDDTSAIQKIVSSFHNVKFSKHYIITDTIELTNPGIYIEGIGVSSMFGYTASIKNTTANKGIFHITTQTNPGQMVFPSIKGIHFIADYPIVFNNPETAIIADGTSSNIPYGMKPIIINCSFSTLTGGGVGTAITLVKCFDARIQNCEINAGFNIGILLLGTDISVISNNRIWGCGYCICDFSTGTFGSQNNISDNDLLRCSTAFIKTTDTQVRIFNNYMEKTSGTCIGIDITNIGFETIGITNTNSYIYSIHNFGNRFECAEGIFYRITDNCRHVVINENTYPRLANDLKIVDSTGNDSAFYTYTPNASHIFDIKINNTFVYNRNVYDNRDNKHIIITNNTSIPGLILMGNHFYRRVNYSNNGNLIFKPGSEAGYFDEVTLKVQLKRNTKYIIRICAKSYITDTPSTINTIKMRNRAGYGFVNSFITSDEYQNFDINLITDDTFNNQGIAILNISEDIIIKSIEFFVADRGTTSERPSYSDLELGFKYFDTTINKPIYWNGTDWVDSKGNNADFKSQGTFEQKPSDPSIGFSYFCTDKQTTEGAADGMMIYYKGNNVWVDALGRVIS